MDVEVYDHASKESSREISKFTIRVFRSCLMNLACDVHIDKNLQAIER